MPSGAKARQKRTRTKIDTDIFKMKNLLSTISFGILAALSLTACTETTGSLGIFDTQDVVTTSTATYPISTRSVAMGPVLANNANAYLGNIVDPETGGIVSADFAAQFYCFENYALPPKEQMVGDLVIDPATKDTVKIDYGVVQCDSCEVRIFLSKYYGDDNNPMKLEVYELDGENIMQETSSYHTDVDLTKYVKASKPLATKVFTPRDYILSEAELDESSHQANIRVMLPASFGQRILEKYYENPKNFKDSYTFIRNVLPGLYFRISNGEGTMLTTRVTMINISYNYADKNNPRKIYEALTRFSATPEVIQSTHLVNGNIDNLLLETDGTYLKTPAGICTEMTLPIDQVHEQHPNDSVSMAKITLNRFNKQQDKYQLGTPTTLLMVRKENKDSFFENHKVADGRTSYVTTFNNARNCYTFNNIARLISYCKHEKAEGAKNENISEAEWEAKHPDWNKVLIIPVVASSNSQNVLTSVSHDMQMNSIKLVGGANKINLEVIYSKYQK